jgi:hypothetical protein
LFIKKLQHDMVEGKAKEMGKRMKFRKEGRAEGEK